MSSKSSGGEHDSTGLGAKQTLITPLLRCASSETATLYSELFETTQQNKKGSHRLPFLHFGVAKNYRPEVPEVIVGRTLFIELEFDANDDAKPGGGDAGPSPNAGGGAGRAMKRDLLSAARQDEPSLGQGQTPTGAVLRIVS